MSTPISIGKFNKKVNSTACQGFSGTTYNCTLREKCDIRNPTVIVEGSAQNYNYAEWNGRYYWVDKVIPYPNGIIEVHMHLDPLATYKQAIFDTYAYMSFNSLYMNTEIDDPRMNPEEIDPTTTNTIISDFLPTTPTPQDGSVIITTFEAGQGSDHQGVKTYALSLGGFRAMLKNLQTTLYDSQWDIANANNRINNNLSNFTTPSDDANMLGSAGSVIAYSLYKGLTDLMSNIGGMGSWRDNLIKAVYVPIPISAFDGFGSKTIYLGYTSAGGTGKLIPPAYVQTKTTSGVIPWCGECNTFHFLKFNKYSKMQASCNGQYVDLNTDLFRNKTGINSFFVHGAMDICSGDWSAYLMDGSSVDSMRLAAFGGNFGIDIIGLAGRGGLGAGMNYTLGGLKIAASVLSMGFSNSVGGSDNAISMATGVMSNYIQNQVGNPGSGIAGNGISSMFLNGSTGFNDITISSKCFVPSICYASGAGSYGAYCGKYGYPCNQYGMLGSYTGAFIKCEGAVVSCEGNQQDQAYINATMNSGIYIEN